MGGTLSALSSDDVEDKALEDKVDEGEVDEDKVVDDTVDSAPDVDETGDQESVEPISPPGPTRGRWLAAILVCAAVLIAGIAWGVMLFDSHRTAQAVDARDAQILSTTETVAADLVTLRHNTADADVARIRANSTGDFQSQISDTTGSFSAILRQGQVDSEGKARQVAIVSADDHHATTIAAVTSVVKNSETPDGQQRVYRMKLSLDNHGGRWLISNVEFVS